MSEQESLRPLGAGARKELEAATAAYQGNLGVGESLLLEARGLEEAVVAFARLGVVADPFPGHHGMVGFLSIPYLDRNGLPLTIRFRCLEEHDHRAHGHGKYMSVADDPSRTYNIGAIHEAAATGEPIHVCEGELDALVLTQLGLHAVAIPGASGWNRRHSYMLAGFNEIYVWGDPDEAGDRFSAKVLRSMRAARRVRLDHSVGDVTDTYLAGGREAVLQALKEASQ